MWVKGVGWWDDVFFPFAVPLLGSFCKDPKPVVLLLLLLMLVLSSPASPPTVGVYQ